MARLSPVILTTWALLLVPWLCVGGLLHHPCEADDGAACAPHESDCDEDPCARLVLVRSEPRESGHPAAAPMAAPGPVQPKLTPSDPLAACRMPANALPETIPIRSGELPLLL